MPRTDLTLADRQQEIQNTPGKSDWVTVCSFTDSDNEKVNYFSTLVDDSCVHDFMQNYDWNWVHHQSMGYKIPSSEDPGSYLYRRFRDDGIEPLVFIRCFAGKPEYYEVSQEFCHYFGLYEDAKSQHERIYWKISDYGDEEEVIRLNAQEVKIRLRFLKEFLSIRRMHLALHFEFMRFSDKTLDELQLKENYQEFRGEDYTFCLQLADMAGWQNRNSQGWILGKKLIRYGTFVPDEWIGNHGKKYEEFIIGKDEDEEDKFHTCNGNYLPNYSVKDTGRPNFMTPVFFKREVLKKYYDNPDKYTVGPLSLECLGFWKLYIDNERSDFVAVPLGYLGGLYHNEQLHWKTHNVRHEGGFSETARKIWFEIKPAALQQPDLKFKSAFDDFQYTWRKKYDWCLFKPLSQEDAYNFVSLRVPTSNSQKEFDELVVSLTKIVIDSLNEKELTRGVPDKKGKAGSINRLEAFLRSKTQWSDEPDQVIKFMRNLQTLRSESVHRKSNKNRQDVDKARIYFRSDPGTHQQVFQGILEKAVQMLASLKKCLL